MASGDSSSSASRGSRFVSLVAFMAAPIRAARGLIDLKQAELARQAGVALRTLKRIESGADAYARTLDALRAALERRGIEFIAENGGGPGVRLRKGAKR